MRPCVCVLYVCCVVWCGVCVCCMCVVCVLCGVVWCGVVCVLCGVLWCAVCVVCGDFLTATLHQTQSSRLLYLTEQPIVEKSLKKVDMA